VPRARPFRLTAPVVREHPIQVAIARVLTIELAPPGKVSRHGVVWFSIDHANYAGEVPGIRISRGIIAGIPDTFVMWRGRTHLIEVKPLDGELSDAQKSVMAAVLAGGGSVGVVLGPDETLQCLDTWRIPRAGRVRIAA